MFITGLTVNQTSETRLRVECHAGYKGDESPARFYLGERLIEVEDILDRWLDPDHRYFKVKGNDGGIYILRQDAVSDTWELTLFNSGTRSETRLSST